MLTKLEWRISVLVVVGAAVVSFILYLIEAYNVLIFIAALLGSLSTLHEKLKNALRLLPLQDSIKGYLLIFIMTLASLLGVSVFYKTYLNPSTGNYVAKKSTTKKYSGKKPTRRTNYASRKKANPRLCS